MNELDELRRLALLAYVIDAGGYAPAARKLGLTRSAVSKQISALEDSFGTRLIQRNSRQLRPTEVGERLYQTGVRIVAELEQASREARSMSDGVAGTLKVTAPLDLGERMVAPLMAELSREYPNLHVELHLDDRTVDLIADGVDVAIRIGVLEDSALQMRRLAVIEQWLCASPGYLEARGVPQTPDDLADHDCILYTFDDEPLRWTFIENGRERDVRVNGRVWANSGGCLKAFAVAGAGIVMLASPMLQQALDQGQLVAILTDCQVPSCTLSAIYPSRKHLDPKVRAFVDLAAERIPRLLDGA